MILDEDKVAAATTDAVDPDQNPGGQVEDRRVLDTMHWLLHHGNQEGLPVLEWHVEKPSMLHGLAGRFDNHDMCRVGWWAQFLARYARSADAERVGPGFDAGDASWTVTLNWGMPGDVRVAISGFGGAGAHRPELKDERTLRDVHLGNTSPVSGPHCAGTDTAAAEEVSRRTAQELAADTLEWLVGSAEARRLPSLAWKIGDSDVPVLTGYTEVQSRGGAGAFALWAGFLNSHAGAVEGPGEAPRTMRAAWRVAATTTTVSLVAYTGKDAPTVLDQETLPGLREQRAAAVDRVTQALLHTDATEAPETG